MRETATVPVPARDRRQSLERRLAAYALASGSIMVAADQASAGIFYSGVRDVPIGNQQTVNLNLNDTGPLADSVDDFVFRHLNTLSGLNQTLTLRVTPLGSNEVVLNGSFAAALPLDDLISADDVFGGGNRTMATYQFKLNSLQSSAGPWRNADGLFLGLRFEIPGDGVHYGWARLSLNTNNTATGTLHDWAYEGRPDTPILAGAVPEPTSLAMLATGAVGVAALIRRRTQA